MVIRHWLEGEVVVTLLKDFTTGTITWNPHFRDPSYGEWANKYIVTKLGTVVIFTVRYAWKKIYGGLYSDSFRVKVEKLTGSGNWVVIPNGYHEPTSAEFGHPGNDDEGNYDKNFEIIADEPKVPFRITAEIKVGGHLPGDSGSPGSSGSWGICKETRQFQIEVRKCRCNR